MQVLLDTAIYVGDFLRRGALAAVLEQARREKISLLVPKIVLEETGRQYAEKLSEAIDRARAPIQKLRDLGVAVEYKSVDVQEVALNYLEQLTIELRSVGAQILEYPTTSHEQVAGRAVTRRKPFAQSGKGYQDTLIWLSLLDRLPFGPVILVSTNTTDFGDGDSGRLAPDLVADLEQAGYGPEFVEFETSTRNLLNRLVATSTAIRERVDEFLQDQGIWDFLDANISNEVEAAARGDVALNEVLGDADEGWVEVAGVDVLDVEQIDAHEAGENLVLVYLEAQLVARLTVYREAASGDRRIYERGGVDAAPVPEERSVQLSAEVTAMFDFAEEIVHAPELVQLTVIDD